MSCAPIRRVVRSALMAAVGAAAVFGCSPGGTEETAVSRGDQAFARDSLEEALAEYRLAVRQGDDDPATLARVAHTYVRMGRVEEARDFYGRAAEVDGAVSDQAVSDFVDMARGAAERNDRFQMASAMDAALSFRPGVSVQELALPLARHYFDAGEYGRALPFYQRALAAATDSAPELVFEIGQAYEQIGNCERALVFFERYRDAVRPWERGEVDWYVGNCAFELARERRLAARAAGPGAADPAPGDDESVRLLEPSASTDSAGPVPLLGPEGTPASREELLGEALRLVNRTLEVGQPRTLLGRAWFERGEILSALGDCRGALEAFDAVSDAEASANSALARRARERYDRIQFGRGLRGILPDGSCG